MKQYFTVDEANRMIPMLEAAFQRMLQMHLQIRTLYHELEEAGVAPFEEAEPSSETEASPELVQKLANLKVMVAALEDELQWLRQRGCLVKSVETGLVDWYALQEGREIFLCWKFGEKSVQYWHELEAGYRGRRSVSELSESEASQRVSE